MYLCVRFALHFNFVSVISEYYGFLCFADSEYVSESERKYGESFSNFSNFFCFYSEPAVTIISTYLFLCLEMS